MLLLCTYNKHVNYYTSQGLLNESALNNYSVNTGVNETHPELTRTYDHSTLESCVYWLAFK